MKSQKEFTKVGMRWFLTGHTYKAAESSPKPPPPESPPAGDTALATKGQVRQAVVAALLTGVSMSSTELARDVGYPQDRVRECIIDHDWFRLRNGKWELTPEGRAV